MRVLGIAVLILGIAATAGCLKKELSAEEQATVNELKGELSETKAAISLANLEDQRLSGGLVKALIEARLQVLLTNKALLEQRINAIESGAAVKEVIPSTKANPELASTLAAELEKAQTEAAIAQAEAAAYGGLVGALKASTAATADQTVALLKQQYLVAKFGITVPTLKPVASPATASGTASGGIPRTEVEACANTGNTSERVACYETLAVRNGIVAVNNSSNGSGKWMTSSKTDPLTDETIATAMLSADSPSRRDTPMLIVRCKAKSTELYISWNDYLGRSAFVTSRVGQEKATTNEWSISTDSKATFYPGNAVGVLKRIIESESFVASVTPYNESPVTAVFDAKGASEALADIRKNCSW